MNDNEINIAIAEACGWRPDKRGLGWLSPHGYYAPEPDYLTDLNAMHSAEETLNSEQLDEYHVQLIMKTYRIYRATARQRAEAFLRTLGKWKD